jgi:hypothetical protein
MGPTFICKLCGASHVSEVRDDAPTVTPEEAETRRKAWHVAEERNQGEEGQERRALQTSVAYFGTMRSNVWKLPSTITTAKDEAGFYFLCRTHTMLRVLKVLQVESRGTVVIVDNVIRPVKTGYQLVRGKDIWTVVGFEMLNPLPVDGSRGLVLQGDALVVEGDELEIRKPPRGGVVKL